MFMDILCHPLLWGMGVVMWWICYFQEIGLF